ncbi:MAG TPA: DUF6785 family protein [Armatimonadota bacterium]|nr:DUF6785 family protein [Armatimonadota bacterium]
MPAADTPRASRVRGLSARAVLLAVALIPLNIVWIQSMELVWNSGQPTMLSLFFNAVFVLLVLALGNLALRRWLPRLALRPDELAVVYVMVSFASAVGGHDFLQVLVLMLPAGAYYATPENHWGDLLAKHPSPSLLVTDPEAIRHFWEGSGSPELFHGLLPWLKPAAMWLGFALVLLGVMMCINTLVWRRWTEQEKLTYPLTEIPFQVCSPGFKLIGPSLFGSGLLWVGLALAGGIDLLNGLAHLYPSLPSLKLTAHNLSPLLQANPWKAMGNTWVSVYPFAIGLGYLMPQDFLFSCWFFYWFWKLELIVGALIGQLQTGLPHVPEQTFGAYLGIAVFALWAGRKYFTQIARDVLRGVSPADEPRQAVSYRVAFAGLAVGGVLLTGFMVKMLGASVVSAVVYLVAYLLMSLAMTRMRAEFGLPVHDLFTGPLAMMVNIGGSKMWGQKSIVGLSLLWWLERVQRSHPMPHGLEGLSLGERRGVRGSGMLAAIGIAAVVGAVATVGSLVRLGSTHGFATLGTDAPYLGNGGFSRPASWLAYRRPPNLSKLGALGVGAAFTVALMLLRQRYVWWPFHPVGFAASSIWFIGLLWVPLFVAWVIKGLVIRYGGNKLYSRLVPLFVGLVLGEFLMGGLWGLIGAIGRFPTYRFWAY